MVTDKAIYDLVIIGAGPIGLACAIDAQKHGLNYLVLEKGCLVNSIFHFPTNLIFFSTPDLLEIGGIRLLSRRKNLPAPTCSNTTASRLNITG